MNVAAPSKIQINSELKYGSILTPEAIEFLTQLHLNFNQERKELLVKRKEKRLSYQRGHRPTSPVETREIRERKWTALGTPKDLQDRRVEITGPVDRKMVINALNSGAQVFMADFEDASSPTWKNMMQGQINLKDANRRNIDFETNGKAYQLNKSLAVLKVRPRGLHLEEKHLTYNGELMAASLVDFGLYFFHNIQHLINKNTSTYFYLPKLEYYDEAAWWAKVFKFAEAYLNIPKASIKCTVLIETITASFCLDEIIFSLRDYIVGLNCGRWDYIFSYIKKLKDSPNFFVPNRDQITMETPFMQSYAKKVVQVCHKRNIHAIGGMAAQIPIRGDDEANQKAFNKVKKDKLREATNGHDGTWVAHPALISVAREVFDNIMPQDNQIKVSQKNETFSDQDLIELPEGYIDETGIRKNINVGILYLESWLMGTGAAALYHLMEDAATAEISRTQLWLWLKQKQVTKEGNTCTASWFLQLIDEEIKAIKKYVGVERFTKGRFTLAKKLFTEMILAEELDEFLTIKAYNHLT